MARAKAETVTPAALKLKTCKKKIRVGGQQVACAKQYLGAEGNCPNNSVHVIAIRTGYCNSGWHEGSKATDWKGDPAPTCPFYLTCPCECHDELGRLFELTESERILVEASGYQAHLNAFVMPSVDDADESFMDADANGPRTVEDAVLDAVPAPLARAYGPTPTGRAARGELEAWVKSQCDIYLIEEYTFPCTPQWISIEIGRDQAITPPSVGAIGAVFERWVKLGFAVIEKKPTRFVKYTEEGVRLGLVKMKAEVKRQEHIRKSNLRRGIR